MKWVRRDPELLLCREAMFSLLGACAADPSLKGRGATVIGAQKAT